MKIMSKEKNFVLRIYLSTVRCVNHNTTESIVSWRYRKAYRRLFHLIHLIKLTCHKITKTPVSSIPNGICLELK